MLVEVVVVRVTALVEVETVVRSVEVEVTVATPPKGANCRIVDSAPPDVIVRNLGLEPTIQPLVSEIMYTDVRIGSSSPMIAGEVMSWLQAIPSQCRRFANRFPGKPEAQQSPLTIVGSLMQYTDFNVAAVCPLGLMPSGMVGVGTGLHLVPSQ